MPDAVQKSLDLNAFRNQFWPFNLGNGFSVRPSTEAEVNQFLKNNFAAVFPETKNSNHFSPSDDRRAEMKPVADLYRSVHHEFFLFCDSMGNPVGWSMNEAENHITFYMRNTGILPEYQNRGLYTAFLKRFTDYISAIGYERISSQHQTTNRRILIRKLKDEFNIVGFEMTETWGPLVKLVKILRPDRNEAFHKLYGSLNHRN